MALRCANNYRTAQHFFCSTVPLDEAKIYSFVDALLVFPGVLPCFLYAFRECGDKICEYPSLQLFRAQYADNANFPLHFHGRIADGYRSKLEPEWLTFDSECRGPLTGLVSVLATGCVSAHRPHLSCC